MSLNELDAIKNLLELRKHYVIKVKKEDTAKALLRFLTCPYSYIKEIGFINENPTKYSKGFLAPRDMFLASFTDKNIPSLRTIQQWINASNWTIDGTCALDKKDKRRLKILKLKGEPEDGFLVTTGNCDDYDEELINKVIKWVENVDEVVESKPDNEKQLYTPLQLIKQLEDSEPAKKSFFENRKNLCRQFASTLKMPFRDFTEEEFVRYANSNFFGVDLGTGDTVRFITDRILEELKHDLEEEGRGDDKTALETARTSVTEDIRIANKLPYFPKLLKTLPLGTDMSPEELSPEDFKAEAKDEFLFPIYIDRWARNKQVYKPDADFARMLLETEIEDEDETGVHKDFGVLLSREMVDHIPYKEFYIDLEDCEEIFNTVKGIFVAVCNIGNAVHANIYILAKNTDETDDDVYYFSNYAVGFYGEDNTVKMTLSKFDKGENPIEYEGMISLDREDAPISRGRASVFAMQTLAYLSSKEPDILESPITKGTYKQPPKKQIPRNDFKEVQMWEVGVKFGAAFRFAQKQREEEEGCSRKSSGSRRAPLPYFRRAHWQRYWTGKGRTVCVVKWIEPTFVQGRTTIKPEQTDVKIHIVTESKGKKDA